jgi:hypothetical protein
MAEKRQALNRAHTLRAYIEAVEEVLRAPSVEMQKKLDGETPHD